VDVTGWSGENAPGWPDPSLVGWEDRRTGGTPPEAILAGLTPGQVWGDTGWGRGRQRLIHHGSRVRTPVAGSDSDLWTTHMEAEVRGSAVGVAGASAGDSEGTLAP
jgi:hypothetical protein